MSLLHPFHLPETNTKSLTLQVHSTLTCLYLMPKDTGVLMSYKRLWQNLQKWWAGDWKQAGCHHLHHKLKHYSWSACSHPQLVYIRQDRCVTKLSVWFCFIYWDYSYQGPCTHCIGLKDKKRCIVRWRRLGKVGARILDATVFTNRTRCSPPFFRAEQKLVSSGGAALWFM